MKYLLLVALLALTGCYDNGENATDSAAFICLDKVSYWVLGMGQSQMMAVRIDPTTLQPRLCK